MLALIQKSVRFFREKLDIPPHIECFTNRVEKYKVYEIGDFTYGCPQILEYGEGKSFKMGKFCSIAPGVLIFLGGEHRKDWVSTYPFCEFFPNARSFSGHPGSKGNVIIGNDVWIGRNAVILSGVSIGDGAVIGASALVTKDVPPYSIFGGNPARHIKFRFSEMQIAALLRIKWWEWSLSEIERAYPLLLSQDIQVFIECYDPLLSTK